MKRIGILTGGGDCPGLNAVIRAIVWSAKKEGWTCIGFLQGWKGIIENIHEELTLDSVSGILPVGGSILRTSHGFCAVRQVMAVVPCTPRAANVWRSAWMPAPPPLSEPAMVRTRR